MQFYSGLCERFGIFQNVTHAVLKGIHLFSILGYSLGKFSVHPTDKRGVLTKHTMTRIISSLLLF